jgi:HlyD family secretion protein
MTITPARSMAETETASRTTLGSGDGALHAKPPRTSRRLPLVAFGVLAALALAVIVIVRVTMSGTPAITASGTIEAIESDAGAKVGGRLTRLLVSDGQHVRAGQALALLDPIDQLHALQQAQANLEQATVRVPQADVSLALQSATVRAQLDQARAAQVSAQAQVDTAAAAVAAAQANLTAANASAVKNAKDLSRAQTLYAQGYVSAQSLDAAREAADAARALSRAASANSLAAERQLEAAQAGFSQAHAAVAVAQANLKSVTVSGYNVSANAAAQSQARAALALAQTQLNETTIRAPFDGVVLSHSAEAGDLLAAGAPVVTLIADNSLYLRVYVTETDLSRIKLGQHVDVTVDGLPQKTFDGVVVQIDDQAQFTPSNVQTKDQRAELVFGVKIDLHDTSGALKSGLPADASFRVSR